MKRDLLIILTIVLSCSVDGPLADGSLSSNSTFMSPNGRYIVRLVTVEKEQHFQITDLKTKQVNDSIVMPTLLMYLHWASNSQSFVTIEHIAEGSYGRLVLLRNDKWNSLEIMPPNNSMMRFSVVSSKLEQERVHFFFCVERRKEKGFFYDYAFYNVDVELRTGKVLDATWTPTSQAEFLPRLKGQPSYMPPMTQR
jgi:hypothetical protein